MLVIRLHLISCKYIQALVLYVINISVLIYMYVFQLFIWVWKVLSLKLSRHPQPALLIICVIFTAGFSMVPDKTSEWDFPLETVVRHGFERRNCRQTHICHNWETIVIKTWNCWKNEEAWIGEYGVPWAWCLTLVFSIESIHGKLPAVQT